MTSATALDLQTVSDEFRETMTTLLTKIGVDLADVDHIDQVNTRCATYRVTMRDGTARWL